MQWSDNFHSLGNKKVITIFLYIWNKSQNLSSSGFDSQLQK